MFSADSSAVLITNIDAASLLQVKNAWHDQAHSLHLLSVILTPGTEDSLQMEKEVKGTLNLNGDSLIFSPEQPFQKGKTYLVESYIGVEFADMGKLFNGSIKHNLQPQKQILTR